MFNEQKPSQKHITKSKPIKATTLLGKGTLPAKGMGCRPTDENKSK